MVFFLEVLAQTLHWRFLFSVLFNMHVQLSTSYCLWPWSTGQERSYQSAFSSALLLSSVSSRSCNCCCCCCCFNAASRCCWSSKCCFRHFILLFWNHTFTWQREVKKIYVSNVKVLCIYLYLFVHQIKQIIIITKYLIKQ